MNHFDDEDLITGLQAGIAERTAHVHAPDDLAARARHRARGPRPRPRPRVLAGGTLGLAGVGAALVLALSATGAGAPPAYAITTAGNGTVTVNLTTVQAVPAAERQLASMLPDEWAVFAIAPGADPGSGPVTCTPTSGTAVQVLLGSDGTGVVPAGERGAGPWHLVGCFIRQGAFPGVGDTGNTGSPTVG